MFLVSPPIKIEAERANQYSPEYSSWYVWTVFILSGIALAVWCLPYVPAVRYLTLMSLLFLVVPIVWVNRNQLISQPITKLAIIWVIYLAIWPFFSTKYDAAIQAWKDEWVHASLTLLVGAGVGWIFTSLHKVLQRRIYLTLAWLSLTPCILHVVMTLGLWLGLIPLTAMGWFGYPPPSTLADGQYGSLAAFPWGYWGIHIHHAEFGYSALTASIFIGAAAFSEKTGKVEWGYVIPIFTIGVASGLIAHSRASLLFLGIISLAIFSLQFWSKRVQLKSFMITALLLSSGLVLIAVVAVKTDSRWQQTFQVVEVLFKVEKPEYVCLTNAGLQPQNQEPMDVSAYSRVAYLSVGLKELTQHPWGYDGSRSSFSQLAKKYCLPGYSPPAHTHNGWVDMGISIGIPGVLIWFSLLVAGVRFGWSNRMILAGRGIWLCALVMIVRALVDSVFRDHTLEMWSFVFMLFVGALISAKVPIVAGSERIA